MAHASITTTALYLHRKPAEDDADKLSRLVTVSQNAEFDVTERTRERIR